MKRHEWDDQQYQLIQDALDHAGVKHSLADIMNIMGYLDKLGYGIWHDDDLDGG